MKPVNPTGQSRILGIGRQFLGHNKFGVMAGAGIVGSYAASGTYNAPNNFAKGLYRSVYPWSQTATGSGRFGTRSPAGGDIGLAGMKFEFRRR